MRRVPIRRARGGTFASSERRSRFGHDPHAILHHAIAERWMTEPADQPCIPIDQR